MSRGRHVARLLALYCALCTVALPYASHLHAQALLDTHDALYARLVRLTHAPNPARNGLILATVTSFEGGNHVGVYRSADDGVTFAPSASITDPDFAGGLCCGTLFELPQPVGDLAAGTLLWAGSVGQHLRDRRMQLKVYASIDQGASWRFRTAIVAADAGGLWEPQFTIARDGALVMFYSDEGHPAQSQIVNRARTYDGVHWQDITDTVASTAHPDRPGMPVVNRLPDGTYLMTFELCGPAACAVRYTLSPDGWNWGDPTNLGTPIFTPEGLFFEHAPFNAVLPNGSILLGGQMELNADGSVAPGNGGRLFLNVSGDPAKIWTTLSAPVPVPGAYDNYCPNYSSPLLPSADGSAVLEFANRYVGHHCLMFYARGSLLRNKAALPVARHE